MKKQKIIFFVGHDNSGKTSIAKELSKKIKVPYFKNPSCYFNGNNLLKLKIEAELEYEFLKQTSYSVIRDRSYICEYVYSKVFNRKTDYKYLNILDEKYSKLNTYIICCFKNKVKDYKDDFVDEKFLNDIKNTYFFFLSQITKCNFLILNTTSCDIKKQMKKIMEFIK